MWDMGKTRSRDNAGNTERMPERAWKLNWKLDLGCDTKSVTQGRNHGRYGSASVDEARGGKQRLGER
ncbi:hypothetical protein Pyn_23730 [Prunus yedoensis var. nudiflora]|uniref:Uncharacterized protein n=1 Tax=Prunus yedoensis var. nudiflora TaxID=2094558 RepID=A0A314ZP49_PRUYE|nr:hypothetical protein Pyn_23730 [Prunus yedoensis var. nudiflora]